MLILLTIILSGCTLFNSDPVIIDPVCGQKVLDTIGNEATLSFNEYQKEISSKSSSMETNLVFSKSKINYSSRTKNQARLGGDNIGENFHQIYGSAKASYEKEWKSEDNSIYLGDSEYSFSFEIKELNSLYANYTNTRTLDNLTSKDDDYKVTFFIDDVQNYITITSCEIIEANSISNLT